MSVTMSYLDRTQWSSKLHQVGTTTVLSSSKVMDNNDRVGYIGHSSATAMLQSFQYSYDFDRVTQVTREKNLSADEQTWFYGYDAKGQVTSADKRFSTNGVSSASQNFLAGYQTDYTYDQIGNRISSSDGGTSSPTAGTGTRTRTYTPNALNQYTAVTNPAVPAGGTFQKFEVTGRRNSTTDNIQVNGTAASYEANGPLHYYRLASVGAGTAGIGKYNKQTVTNTAAYPAATLDEAIFYIPPVAEAPVYDADGNLRQDGRWDYLWDAENRLTQQTSRHTPTAAYPYKAYRISHRYDGLSRRVWKQVETIDVGGSWSVASSISIASVEFFLYDGWNLISRVNLNPNLNGTQVARQNYVWGPDIGSTPKSYRNWQNAGGVAGLLMVGGTAANDNQFPLMDRMGNVTGYRRASMAPPAGLNAVYDCDAFGREMKSVGVASDAMPFRFSTKFTDGESGLVYYGYRFYDSEKGRWVNRDPIGERGGKHVFGFVANRVPGRIDLLGRSPYGEDLPIIGPLLQQGGAIFSAMEETRKKIAGSLDELWDDLTGDEADVPHTTVPTPPAPQSGSDGTLAFKHKFGQANCCAVPSGSASGGSETIGVGGTITGNWSLKPLGVGMDVGVEISGYKENTVTCGACEIAELWGKVDNFRVRYIPGTTIVMPLASITMYIKSRKCSKAEIEEANEATTPR